MKIDLNIHVHGLDGKQLSDDSLGRVLASEFVRSNASPSVVVLDWAESLWNHSTLDLTEKDIEGLINLIDSLGRLPVLIRGSAIRQIQQIRELAQKSPS